MISRSLGQDFPGHYPSHHTSLKHRSSNMVKQRIECQEAKILMIFPVPIEQTMENR